MKIEKDVPVVERRKQLEKHLGITLNEIGKVEFLNEKVHCENLIGGTTLPMGIAGPLRIEGFKKEVFIPLATTEGALVASVNRGCKAVVEAGGAHAHIETAGVTRGPVFEVKDMREGILFKKWLEANFSVMARISQSTSRHLELLRIDKKLVGTYVYVRLYYDTGDAMGMNMVTIATQSIVDHIEKTLKIRCLALSGNYCVDKKPAMLNFITGRGKSGWGEVILTKKIVTEVLKTSPERLYDTWLGKCIMGSAAAGSLGFNAHFANVVAAFFAATGQDLAHVVEGSMGITTVKILPGENVYFSVYLPSIMLGTVGGGTKLKSKQEALSIMGVTNSADLAKVLVGAVLAGELSLLSSLAQGNLAKTHERLGR